MRSIRKQWPGRLIAAVMALALICASAVGAYAHVAAHGPHHHGDSHAAKAADTASAVHTHADKSSPPCAKHGTGDSGAGHADCCDLMCHGWTAVLGAKFALPVPLQLLAGMGPGRSAAGVRPSSLERPPRPLVLA